MTPNRRQTQSGAPAAPSAGHAELHPCNSQNPLDFREVRASRRGRGASICRFPEPPIEFLLVGTRGNAEYGTEIARQQCGRSSAGRAPPCQGGCREFESRRPLAGHCHGNRFFGTRCLHGGLAERRGSGLQSRIHGFESRTHLGENLVSGSGRMKWAIGAAVARFPDTEEVTGSIPVSPTKARQLA